MLFLPDAEFYVAIDNKGLWPNLTLLPNGEIVAVVYDHPSHGYGNGNVEMWASDDGGRLWSLRSVVSDHFDQPEVVRMNHSVGLTAAGELLVLVGGWSKGRELPFLPVQVCRSADNGHTWNRHILSDIASFPYSNVVLGADSSLTSAIHDDVRCDSLLYTSRDGGTRGVSVACLGDPGDETSLLRLRDGTLVGRHAHLAYR